MNGKLWYLLTVFAFSVLAFGGCSGDGTGSSVTQSSDGQVHAKLIGMVEVSKSAAATTGTIGKLEVFNAYSTAGKSPLATADIQADGSFSGLNFTLPGAKSVILFKASLSGPPVSNLYSITPMDLTIPATGTGVTNNVSISISKASTTIATTVLGANLAPIHTDKTFASVAAAVTANGGYVLSYANNILTFTGSVTVPPAVKKVLFVGNSYTFARIAPALQYNSANVSDLTAAFNAIDPAGGNSYPVGSGVAPNPCLDNTTGCFEPHNWGGVPGIFKRLTDQAGLNYEVSISARNAATLRGQFLNTANANWDLRSNMAKQKWDLVVLQAQSDEPLPVTRSKNGNFVSFSTYLDQIEKYIHLGTGSTTSESEIFGSLANCTAAVTANPPGPGLSTANCGTSRVIPANANANPNAKIYLFQSWARPDMVEAHKCTKADISTTDGAPIVDTTCSNGANGSSTTGLNTVYYTSKATTAANLNDMTTDLHNVFFGRVISNRNFAGVAPVGDAFQRAVDSGVVKTGNFYKTDGTFDDSGSINLWWKDRTHASVHGSYLAGLIMYGTLTGLDPQSFGTNEKAFGELGITTADALKLQKVAHDTLVAAGTLPN
ncbi:MAG: hypothetical protein WCP20_12535 [Desulfuromonadales bacterium]